MMDSLFQWFQDPGNLRIMAALVGAFGLGVLSLKLISRTRGSQKSKKSSASQGDEAFFKGIQYILSDETDSAIEEFTKFVQVNSDTIETYVALGNLYRSKGDIERAIRIRQSIILRHDVDQEIKLQALFDLGLDYKKGGFLNRALDTFLQVAEKRPSDLKVLKEVERIYEEQRDWENAFKTRQKISKLSGENHRNILAHHLVEMGKAKQEQGELSKAKSYFSKAISTDQRCVDAYLHLGDLLFEKGDYKKAISTWKKIVHVAPQFTYLAYRRLEGAYSKMKNLKPIEDFLRESLALNSDAFTHLALSRYLYSQDDLEGALREVRRALELAPQLWEARRFQGHILLAHGRDQEALEAYEELLAHLDVPFLKFQCSQCGLEPPDLQWQCPNCKHWDSITLVETSLSKDSTRSDRVLWKLPYRPEEK